MAPSRGERGRELARRRTEEDGRARRVVEKGIQRCRTWALLVVVLQAVLAPAGASPVGRWAPAVLLALGCAASEWALSRDRGQEVLHRTGAVGMAGDTLVAVVLMAVLTGDPTHPVVLVPLALAAEAAVRWGRIGGLLGGLGAGALAGTWSLVVQAGLEEPVAMGQTVFGVAVVVLVGALMGTTVGAVRRQRRLAETVIAASSDLIACIDMRSGRIRSVNRASRSILGLDPDVLVGRPGAELLSGGDLTGGPGGDSFRHLDPGLVELPAVHAEGHPVWLQIDVQPDLGEEVVYLMARDITARRTREAAARRRLDDEAATGSANRAHLVARLSRELKGPRRCHLLAIDLGGLAAATEALDPRLGESVLLAAIARVRAEVRTTDLVCRLGGDDLAVLLPAPTSEYEAADTAHRITESLRRPLSAGGQTIDLFPRVGVAASLPTDRPLDLTDRADRAVSEVSRRRHVPTGDPSGSTGPAVGGLGHLSDDALPAADTPAADETDPAEGWDRTPPPAAPAPADPALPAAAAPVGASVAPDAGRADTIVEQAGSAPLVRRPSVPEAPSGRADGAPPRLPPDPPT